MIHWVMLKRPSPEQTALEMVTLEQLVPKDHLLRKIDAVIDFSFIHELATPYYCLDNGRPPLDPTLMFKALFLGYLFGVRSERQLVREIEVNVAYRWFLRLKLTGDVFDASTISANRRRRFDDSKIEQEIFDAIVEQAVHHGMVPGYVLYTDSTHLKADANKNRFTKETIAKSRADYWDALDAAVDSERQERGLKPLPVKARQTDTTDTRVSTTDPDSGYLMREGKPEGFFYLDHRTVDSAFNIITDTYTTPGNINDSRVYLGRLDRQIDRFGFEVHAVGLDAGYATAPIAKGLVDRKIMGVTGYRRPNPPAPGMMDKSRFIYDPYDDGYLCPEGQFLPYATTNREGYRQYRSDPKQCAKCPLLASCTSAKNQQRELNRHIWQDARDTINKNRLTPYGKKIYKRRQETVERSFADAKQLHGHRYARFRSLIRVKTQCLLAAATQNIKKIALEMIKTPKFSPA
jgi:transposase